MNLKVNKELIKVNLLHNEKSFLGNVNKSKITIFTRFVTIKMM